MKEVEHYSNLFEAELNRALLEDNGIMAAVFNKNISYIAGCANNGLLAYNLMVNDEDYLKAKEILSSKTPIDESTPVNE